MQDQRILKRIATDIMNGKGKEEDHVKDGGTCLKRI
jgi:hypothetical protein